MEEAMSELPLGTTKANKKYVPTFLRILRRNYVSSTIGIIYEVGLFSKNQFEIMLWCRSLLYTWVRIALNKICFCIAFYVPQLCERYSLKFSTFLILVFSCAGLKCDQKHIQILAPCSKQQLFEEGFPYLLNRPLSDALNEAKVTNGENLRKSREASSDSNSIKKNRIIWLGTRVYWKGSLVDDVGGVKFV